MTQELTKQEQQLLNKLVKASSVFYKWTEDLLVKPEPKAAQATYALPNNNYMLVINEQFAPTDCDNDQYDHQIFDYQPKLVTSLIDQYLRQNQQSYASEASQPRFYGDDSDDNYLANAVTYYLLPTGIDNDIDEPFGVVYLDKDSKWHVAFNSNFLDYDNISFDGMFNLQGWQDHQVKLLMQKRVNELLNELNA